MSRDLYPSPPHTPSGSTDDRVPEDSPVFSASCAYSVLAAAAVKPDPVMDADELTQLAKHSAL